MPRGGAPVANNIFFLVFSLFWFSRARFAGYTVDGDSCYTLRSGAGLLRDDLID